MASKLTSLWLEFRSHHGTTMTGCLSDSGKHPQNFRYRRTYFDFLIVEICKFESSPAMSLQMSRMQKLPES